MNSIDNKIQKNLTWKNELDEYDGTLEIPDNWKDMFDDIDLSNIQSFLEEELNNVKEDIAILPPKHLVFNAFKLTDPSNLKVVLLGQDPYISIGEPMGLAFSVPEGVKKPRSLNNIFKKLNKVSTSGDLTHWAKQGVLLLNTALTARERISNSHSSKWRKITNDIIKYLSNNFKELVFILWGGNAYSKIDFIDTKRHKVLISSHPSPLGCSKQMKGHSSFNDCNHFNECNEYLKDRQIKF